MAFPASAASFGADPGQVMLADITPPKGVQPPGTTGLSMVLNWTFWGVTFLCVVGVLMVAGAMAVAHRRGEGGEHLAKLGWVMGACVLGAAGAQLVNTLV
jgi:hypothetical protein